MPRFLLLVSFVVVSLLAIATSPLFAGQQQGKSDDHQYKQRELAQYSSLAKALRATHGASDTKTLSHGKKSKLKSKHRKNQSKKLASSKSASSKKASFKKRSASKSHSYRKDRSLKKQIHRKKRSTKTT